MRHIVSLIYLSIIIFSGTTAAFGQSMVIFSPDYKPPKYFKEDGRDKGILIDMTRWIGKEIGYEFDIQLLPWKRAYNYALSGKGGVIGLSMNHERLKIFDYSDVMYYDDILIAVKKDKVFPFDTLNDLKGKRISVLRGASNGDEMDKLLDSDEVEVFRVNSYVHVLRMVLRDRVDIGLVGPGKVGFNMILTKDSALAQAKDQLTVLPKPAVRDPNYFGISKELKAQGFLKKFNQALNKGYDTGVFKKIIDRYENQRLYE